MDAGRFELAHIELNAWAESMTVCRACLDQTRAQRAANRAAGVKGWFYELAPRETARCCRHFVEWFAATGQATLASTIRAGRSATRIFDEAIPEEPIADPARTVICELHGRMPAYPCCVHVSDAIDRGTLEHGQVEVDGRGDPWIVCRRCREQVRAQRTTARNAGQKGWTLTLEPMALDRCATHAAHWYAATGQGGYYAAVHAARAAVGAIDDDTEDDDGTL